VHFLQRQIRSIPVPTTSYAGRTIIVTGANGGLGLEAARHFARLGAARVILACRDTERGEAAKAGIERSVTTSSTVIEVWSLDLCSFDSVRAFCRRADKELERLDVLLANAAMLSIGSAQMAEGYEMQVTTNVISNFLMVLMLLPLMKRTAARWNVETAVTVVASEAHFFVSRPAFSRYSVPLLTDTGRPSLLRKTSRTSLSASALAATCTTATAPPSCLIS
jgi:NAD(P)-dependent dehydrogenase (short-subunit alcohol dehydrogenase family)